MCVDLGLMHDGRLDPCEWCEETNWRIEGKGDHASYVQDKKLQMLKVCIDT